MYASLGFNELSMCKNKNVALKRLFCDIEKFICGHKNMYPMALSIF